MKKLFFTFIMTALVSVSFAQSYKYHIGWVRSEDDLEVKEYSYDENNLLIATYTEQKAGEEWYVRDSMTYDANRNITRLSAYQILQGDWYYANYCDYTYNELNQRITRKNYNHFGEVFELGGTYTYYYNEDGDLNYFELDFFNMLFQKADRVYDNNHHMLEENGQQYSFVLNQLVDSWRVVCNYNADGYLIERYDYNAATDGGPLVETTRNIYTRDSNNNITKAETYSDGALTERHVYTYDETMLYSDLVPVENPENDWPIFHTNYNVMINDEYWAADEQGTLQFITNYEYSYIDIFDSAEEIENSNVVVFPNPATDVITIEADDYQSVEMVDITGKVVFSSEIENSLNIDVKEFNSGVYFVKLNGANGSLTQKVVVK